MIIGSREELLRSTGRLSQMGGVSAFTCAEGRGKGTSTVRVRTATGLEFWVVLDRGLDIVEASYRGSSLCWHSPTGLVRPSFYDRQGLGWLGSFFGGLLTTCGLSTSGAPSTDRGEELGLHGSISNTPAEQTGWSEEWDGEDCIFSVRGLMRESSVFGPNLVLQRTLTSSLRSSGFTLTDTVTNEGFDETPLMLLYHFNFGYPLLTAFSKVYAPSKDVTPVNDWAEQRLQEWSIFEDPVPYQKERVYFHAMEPRDGKVSVVLVRDQSTADFGVELRYDASTLPRFAQWKMSGEGHYVLGLEPANCRTLGRAWERQQGTLETLQPGESRQFNIDFQVLDGTDEVAAAVARSSR